MSSHLSYLLESLTAAQSRRGFCAPNPAVGAVLVKNDRMLAVGAHQAAGQPHAEIEALKKGGEAAQGATLYVSLEPCNHEGRTPACTQAIIQAGIKAVYYAHPDPNSTVKGQGAAALKAAGVECHLIALPEIDAFYASYRHWLKHQRPFVTAKLALSVDGKIAEADGSPVALTGVEAQEYTQEWRRQSDAILTTARTIICDDPQLNVRLEGERISKPLYVLDPSGDLPLKAKVFNTCSRITIFYASMRSERRKALEKQGAVCIELKKTAQSFETLEFLRCIGQDGIHDLWVEAGGRCFESLWQARLLNRILLYLSPKTLGADAWHAFREAHDFSEGASQLSWYSLGQDGVCEIEYPPDFS